MPRANAYAMRWECYEHGCFNFKLRPKFAAFAGAFPGKINFTDVDGIVEMGGRVLVLECKARAGMLPDGQRRLFEALSRLGFTVAIIAGDMRTMELSAVASYQTGKFYDWQPTTFAAFNARLHRWAMQALRR